MSDKIKITDPRGKSVIYSSATEHHILDGHPEMESLLPNVAIEVIQNPDWIREGRNPENSEIYFQVESISGTTFYGTNVATRTIYREDIDEKETIVTTCYEGTDKATLKMKWSKNRGELS